MQTKGTKRTITQVLNIIQKLPGAVINLEIDDVLLTNQPWTNSRNIDVFYTKRIVVSRKLLLHILLSLLSEKAKRERRFASQHPEGVNNTREVSYAFRYYSVCVCVCVYLLNCT